MGKVGPYQILGVVGGGTRPLYRARAADGRVLALKTVAVGDIRPEERERFHREAGLIARLDHPNLVRVYDAGEADGFLYQGMDLLKGADLNQVLAERRSLSWEQKLSIMEQTCDGLAYAHGHNLTHRDVKPANLFLEESGRVRILDFGMARVDASKLTKAGMTASALSYRAPEQIRGDPCTASSDMFAAGIVFWELAAGRHPFASGKGDVPRMLTAILFGTPPALQETAPDAPDGLELALSKALEKDRAKRLASAAGLKQELSACRIR